MGAASKRDIAAAARQWRLSGNADDAGKPMTQHGQRERWHFHLRKLQRHPAFLFTKDSLRVARQLLPNVWRLATCRQRELPSAIIVGAQKAGTTQLYASLIRHPCCFGGVRKEIDYFSKRARWPLAWYQSRFPLASGVAQVHGLCLEASPSYLPSPNALRRMREILPSARIIVILRDPVARAFSHYQHDKSRRRESRPFADVVARAIEEHQNSVAPEFGWAHHPNAKPLLDCVARGYYALQLEALLQAYPREQVLILDSADLFADTNAVCQQVFRYLELDPIEVPTEKVYNRGYYHESIDPATAQWLREHYRPHDQLLTELVGRQFRWMTQAQPTALPRAEGSGRADAA